MFQKCLTTSSDSKQKHFKNRKFHFSKYEISFFKIHKKLNPGGKYFINCFFPVFRGPPDERYGGNQSFEDERYRGAPQVEDSFYRQSPMLDDRYPQERQYHDREPLPQDNYMDGPDNGYRGEEDSFRGQGHPDERYHDGGGQPVDR